MKLVDLSGKTFGQLIVIRRNGSNSYGVARWECLCSCGNITTGNSHHLRNRGKRSCGCYRAKANGHTKNGRTAEYRCWQNIKQRCYNPRYTFYKYYGAMGVAMCPEWLASFKAFLADMGLKPSPSHTIDRYPDPYGNYEPGNCRWATRYEQRHNQRASVKHAK